MGVYNATATFKLDSDLRKNYNKVEPASMSAKLKIQDVVRISVSDTPTEINYGTDLDLSNVNIHITKSDSQEEKTETKKLIDVAGYTISGYDKNKVGVQTVRVMYKSRTTTFEIEVKDVLTGIVAYHNGKENGTEIYTYGETIDKSKITVQAIYASGAKPYVTSSADMSQIPDVATKVGTHEEFVSYEGYTAPITIQVNAPAIYYNDEYDTNVKKILENVDGNILQTGNDIIIFPTTGFTITIKDETNTNTIATILSGGQTYMIENEGTYNITVSLNGTDIETKQVKITREAPTYETITNPDGSIKGLKIHNIKQIQRLRTISEATGTNDFTASDLIPDGKDGIYIFEKSGIYEVRITNIYGITTKIRTITIVVNP